MVEEIILMIKGTTEEQIGENRYKMSTGDLVFIDSTVLHGIRNLDDESCIYFAIQWK